MKWEFPLVSTESNVRKPLDVTPYNEKAFLFFPRIRVKLIDRIFLGVLPRPSC